MFPGSSLLDIVLSVRFNVNVIFGSHDVLLLNKSPFSFSFHNWSEKKGFYFCVKRTIEEL